MNRQACWSAPLLSPQLAFSGGFTWRRTSLYTAFEMKRKLLSRFRVYVLYSLTGSLLLSVGSPDWFRQEALPIPAAEPPPVQHAETAGKSEKATNPAQIELLETKVRFERNGDSRKEVHALVKINSELGVRQFAQLNFDFNRSFEAIEIPLVHITHAKGGTADILPGAVTDRPNPAVVNAPAYQDVRVKSVRILGLQPGDTLEYRVIRSVSQHPLAPDFWLDHTFDRMGVVAHEVFELDLPSLPSLQIQINPETPPDRAPADENDRAERAVYRWTRKQTPESESGKEEGKSPPDISLTTFPSWNQLANRLAALLLPSEQASRQLHDRAVSITSQAANPDQKMSDFYDFVSEKIRTVDLPIGATGFRPRKPADILTSASATAEDKFVLFAALANNFFGPARMGLASSSGAGSAKDLPSPAKFDHLLTMSGYSSVTFWMDLNIEVAPFLMIPSQFRNKPVFMVGPAVENHWETVVASFPFPARQNVLVNAGLSEEGTLTAKVHYSMRGDNELVLRLAFHHSPKEKWKELAQLLSLTDGFRGQVSAVNASDPYATKEPFTVEYELNQPKFVDWSKKTVRIPALLPQLGLPDPPAKSASGSANASIELGTPLEVETRMTLELPSGTTARAPAGTSVERDYAAYSSEYAANGSTVTAARHIKFISREVPGDRAADYNAFLLAVQSDEAQDFTLAFPAAPSSKPAAPPMKPTQP
jgi:Domain of Unknown Function with PDB structure (DUF3857)